MKTIKLCVSVLVPESRVLTIPRSKCTLMDCIKQRDGSDQYMRVVRINGKAGKGSREIERKKSWYGDSNSVRSWLIMKANIKSFSTEKKKLHNFRKKMFELKNFLRIVLPRRHGNIFIQFHRTGQ